MQPVRIIQLKRNASDGLVTLGESDRRAKVLMQMCCCDSNILWQICRCHRCGVLRLRTLKQLDLPKILQFDPQVSTISQVRGEMSSWIIF